MLIEIIRNINQQREDGVSDVQSLISRAYKNHKHFQRDLNQYRVRYQKKDLEPKQENNFIDLSIAGVGSLLSAFITTINMDEIRADEGLRRTVAKAKSQF